MDSQSMKDELKRLRAEREKIEHRQGVILKMLMCQLVSDAFQEDPESGRFERVFEIRSDLYADIVTFAFRLVGNPPDDQESKRAWRRCEAHWRVAIDSMPVIGSSGLSKAFGGKANLVLKKPISAAELAGKMGWGEALAEFEANELAFAAREDGCGSKASKTQL